MNRGKTVNTAKKRQSPDPLLVEMEQELMPGRFIRYGDMFHFVQRLHQVEGKLAALAAGSEAERAVGLYEMFLAGCLEKIEECDDSGDSLGMFWDCLFCGWVKARQAAGKPADETVRQILKWIENDNYGFCYNIQKDVAEVLDSNGYELFVAHYRQLVDDGLTHLQGPKPSVIFEYDNSIRLPAMSLKDIYRAKGDVASYVALCDRMGMSPNDCEHLAEMEKTKRHWKNALAWIERGLALEPTRNWRNEGSSFLNHMKPEILSHLGKKEDALAQTWAEFERNPSEFSYEEFMRYVPKTDRAKWHEKAMEIATGGDMGAFMEICVKTKEWARLATRLHSAKHEELEAVSHYHSEAAAEGLTKRNVAASAKLYRALGFRILNAKKSKYYRNALGNFENARDLYLKAGLKAEWDTLVSAVRADHSRKYGFMPGFEQVVSGGSVERPSFADRVQVRWQKQIGSEKK